MSDFTASNGFLIQTNTDYGDVIILDDIGTNTLADGDYLDGSDILALREYFQAEEDKKLGRWRWPENPDYVVYPAGNPNVAVVRRESQWEQTMFSFESATGESDKHRAARAYFEAHSEPKPWEEAKNGELWMLTLDGEEVGSLVDYGEFYVPGESITIGSDEMKRITAGEKIYPKETS